MKKATLRLILVLFGLTILAGCASDSSNTGASQGISPFPTPGSSRLGIQEAQNRAVRRLSY